MKHLKHRMLTLFCALAFTTMVAGPGLAMAQQGSGNGNNDTVTTGNSSSDQGQGNGSEDTQKKLQGDNLTKCLNSQGKINQYMERINTRAEKQLNLFGTIAERVQKYYQDNKLSLANYDELVTAVEQTRTQAQNAFRAMEQNGGAFSCDSDDPHAYANQFRNSFNSNVDGLKAYKNAVRNLIVGIRSVATGEATNE